MLIYVEWFCQIIPLKIRGTPKTSEKTARAVGAFGCELPEGDVGDSGHGIWLILESHLAEPRPQPGRSGTFNGSPFQTSKMGLLSMSQFFTSPN